MWQSTFETRLARWHGLRQSCAHLTLEESLLTVNDWWMSTPWKPYYLHWDDLSKWPTPWQLLDDNIYCDLARSLGIVYTLLMIDQTNALQIELAETDVGNLVLIEQGKYILNWEPGRLLNISSAKITITKKLDSSRVMHLLG